MQVKFGKHIIRCDVKCVDISDLPCTEIDFVEDLKEAHKLAKSDWFTNQ